MDLLRYGRELLARVTSSTPIGKRWLKDKTRKPRKDRGA